MEKIILQGITWNHSRGYTPLVAASQRFSERHPHVEIHWKKRTLQEFADYPIEELAEQYDLLIIDHPWAGFAAKTGVILPLEKWVSPELLADLAENSVGPSYSSYWFHNHIWALPIDTATPVASYRADLLKDNGVALPQTWDEVLKFAEMGKIAAPGLEVDVLMNFYMFCIAVGEKPFKRENEIVNEIAGLSALKNMRNFYKLLNPLFFDYNPIKVAELMSSTNDYWYCPFAYGYSNYARDGFANHPLTYTDLVTFEDIKLVSTLGGTGLAISSRTQHAKTAVAFASYICSANHQSTFYVQHGGQPGHKQAWLNPLSNTLTHNYFENTLPALDRAFLRPRYNGYLQFQDHAGKPLQDYLKQGGDPLQVLATMNKLYKESLLTQKSNHEQYATTSA